MAISRTILTLFYYRSEVLLCLLHGREALLLHNGQALLGDLTIRK